jgi:DNA-binding NtrC family response regulator
MVRARCCVPDVFKMHGFPTILVARNQDGLDDLLLDCLRRGGFHVLEADDWEHVLAVVKRHSRPIHLLLADMDMKVHAPFLRKHRSELKFLFVNKPVDADDVVAKVRRLLGSPPSLPSIR